MDVVTYQENFEGEMSMNDHLASFHKRISTADQALYPFVQSHLSFLARDPLRLWGGQVVVAPEGAVLLPGGQRTEES